MPQHLHRGAAPAQRKKIDDALNASWEDLRAFLLCARHQSFRTAADALGLTGTTLMRKIDRLEEELGFKLFLRDQSGLSLSDEGRALLLDVEQMERLSFNIFRRASSTDTNGTVRVAVTEGPGNFWILPRLIDFQKTYRKITVDLRCAMEQADVSRLEADISIQLERPTDPDLIVAKLGRLHIYTFASEAYRDDYGLPKSLMDLRNHRIVKQHGVQLDETGYARILGLESLEGIVGISTNSSVAVLYAIERGAGIGFLPTSAIALGAPLVAIDLGINYHMDLWLTYHKEFRNSDRHKVVIDWLKSIFDPKVHACFRDEFIHPNDLVPLMSGSREDFGVQGYVAAKPF
ncbi:LysR family transcriptional regulator [uncultured Bradyrhizobium sp.]|uniref:LysR family transcriptional regulator n=1 Tax=uncultured Bradyrhizobium sp. TaxID=199684 RepID=UPI0035CBE4D3